MSDRKPTPAEHFVLGGALDQEFAGRSFALFAMGCFWGVEKDFWETPGVVSTAVGYSGGHTSNPTYEDACGGRTGHAEVVRVVFDETLVSYADLLRAFWEGHDPTQGMRQGNDTGAQYRSAIYVYDEKQRAAAEASRDAFQKELTSAGYGTITTEIAAAGVFFFAEGYHQQYLAKNPGGYCGGGGTGVSCPIGLGPRVE